MVNAASRSAVPVAWVSCIDLQAIAVLHENVGHVAQFRGLAARLLEQPAVGIGGRGMGGIAALFTAKIMLGVAPCQHIATIIVGAAFLFGRKPFTLAKAWINVPSTEKRSSEISACTRGCRMIADRNLAAMPPACKVLLTQHAKW